MIDLDTETIVTFKKATEYPKLKRNGQKPHQSTIWRWVSNGVRDGVGGRIKLETIRMPYGLCTSTQAIDRFLATLSGNGVAASTATSSSASDAAMRELASAGIA